MNWTSRFTAPIGSAFALLVLLNSPLPARADASLTYQMGASQITLTHVSRDFGAPAIGVNDPAFRSLLRATDAVMTWQPGDRYVLITTPQPLVVSFAVGDRRYDVGQISAQAAFAPYLRGSEVYLPLDEVLRALALAPKRDGSTTVLQPQLTSIDVQAAGSQATVIARGAGPLHARLVADTPSKVVYEFEGVGTTLASTRTVNAGGVTTLALATLGTVRDPKTQLTLNLTQNARHDVARSQNGDFEVAFGGTSEAAANNAPEAPAPQPPPATVPSVTPAPQSQIAAVSAVTVTPSNDGATVAIAISGNTTYEWHRLRAPDNRFWIDVKGARLQFPPREETQSDPLVAVRVRQNDATTVRVALTLSGQKSLAISPSQTGISIVVGNDEVADATRFGSGSTGSVVAASEPQTTVTPAAAGNPPAQEDSWKFGGHAYVPTNPKLIVIDPGHGGSDRGASRNGVTEADLTLDMAKRLRAVLEARGWQVQMTRSSDVDVFKPNDSAHEELQARVDVANNAGARMFVSIHVNSFINSGPSGTTTYYSKANDVPMARAVQSALSDQLGTKNDGIVKSHLYVTLHSYMPAVLVETAFLSNPTDYSMLTSSEWREKVAQAIADGIDQYAQSNPVQSGGGQ